MSITPPPSAVSAPNAAPSPCWEAWFDGSALPNPGKIGLGVLLCSPAGERIELSELGQGSGCNNEAELQAMCLALSFAHSNGIRRLVLYSDSDFAVRHGTGAASTAVLRLVVLIDRARAWAALFEYLELSWVPRHRNGEADRLSRGALGLPHKPAPHPGKAALRRRTG